MKRTAFASLFALALAAGAAHADSVVGGGGGATITGGGDNMTITYSAGGAGGGGSPLRSQPGRLARPTGTPSGTGVEYLEPAPSDPGREAWMLGGGDNAEVVYARPR